MKMKTICILALFSPLLLFADMFQPSMHCYKPSKPYKFNSKWEVENFNSDVERYKDCIENFVEEQNSGIQKHKDAVNKAIEEWNSFVKYELN